MIRHTILFKIRSNISADTVAEAIDGMRALQSKLPGIFSIIGDECHFHDDKSIAFFTHDIAHGATHCISIDFTDQKALDEFFNNPITHPAKSAIVNITENGYDGIVGFDLENPNI